MSNRAATWQEGAARVPGQVLAVHIEPQAIVGSARQARIACEISLPPYSEVFIKRMFGKA